MIIAYTLTRTFGSSREPASTSLENALVFHGFLDELLQRPLDALALGNDDLVLDLGAGLGYSSAVIAHIAEAVVAVEDDEARLSEAESLLAEHHADNVILHGGALSEGAPEHGPYDAILIEGAVEEVPEAIIGQLKEGGRMACLFMEGTLGVVRIGYKLDGGMSWRFSFNASAPVIPGFEKARAFAL